MTAAVTICLVLAAPAVICALGCVRQCEPDGTTDAATGLGFAAGIFLAVAAVASIVLLGALPEPGPAQPQQNAGEALR